jgi:hypothetical protein
MSTTKWQDKVYDIPPGKGQLRVTVKRFILDGYAARGVKQVRTVIDGEFVYVEPIEPGEKEVPCAT